MRQNPIRRLSAPLPGAMALCLVLTGCSNFSQSNYNPANWFSANKNPPKYLYVPAPDSRPMVAQVTALKIEESSDGVIVRAEGLPPTQGWWKAALVKVEQDDPTKLVYDFRIYPPLAPTPSSTPRSREVTVALHVGTVDLEGVTTVTVRGERNALSARR